MFGLDRGKGGNLVVWLLLGILALAFGFTFGLPTDQLSVGEDGFVKVHGETIGKEDIVYQGSAVARVVPLPEGEQAQTLGVREEILEAVIERLVLAHAAEDLGLMAEQRDAELLAKQGFWLVLDQAQPYPWAGLETFDYKSFKGALSEFGVSEVRYLEIQRQELLARQVRDLIRASVTIPEPELRAAYEKDSNQLSLSFVRFPALEYAELVDPTEAEIDAWLVEHEAELDEAWERDRPRFLKLPAQVDLRVLKLAKPIAPPADSAAELVADYETRLAAARTSGALARTRIVEAGESFASVARELSQDTETARSGGRFGWTIITEPGSGLDPIIDSTAATLAEDTVSELIEGKDGLYLVLVAGRREGDVPEDIGKRELAAESIRQTRGRELAKREADEALLAIQDGAKLEDLFQSMPTLGGDNENIEDYLLGGGPVGIGERTIQETGLFAYGEAVPGIGVEPKLVNDAWDSDPSKPILPTVYDIPGAFLIAGVTERQKGDDAGYAEARPKLYEKLIRLRASAVLADFTKHECLVGKGRVEVRVNEAAVAKLMSYDGELLTDPDGNRLTRPYQVCSRVGDFGMLGLNMQLRGNSPR